MARWLFPPVDRSRSLLGLTAYCVALSLAACTGGVGKHEDVEFVMDGGSQAASVDDLIEPLEPLDNRERNEATLAALRKGSWTCVDEAVVSVVDRVEALWNTHPRWRIEYRSFVDDQREQRLDDISTLLLLSSVTSEQKTLATLADLRQLHGSKTSHHVRQRLSENPGLWTSDRTSRMAQDLVVRDDDEEPTFPSAIRPVLALALGSADERALYQRWMVDFPAARRRLMAWLEAAIGRRVGDCNMLALADFLSTPAHYAPLLEDPAMAALVVPALLRRGVLDSTSLQGPLVERSAVLFLAGNAAFTSLKDDPGNPLRKVVAELAATRWPQGTANPYTPRPLIEPEPSRYDEQEPIDAFEVRTFLDDGRWHCSPLHGSHRSRRGTAMRVLRQDVDTLDEYKRHFAEVANDDLRRLVTHYISREPVVDRFLAALYQFLARYPYTPAAERARSWLVALEMNPAVREVVLGAYGDARISDETLYRFFVGRVAEDIRVHLILALPDDVEERAQRLFGKRGPDESYCLPTVDPSPKARINALFEIAQTSPDVVASLEGGQLLETWRDLAYDGHYTAAIQAFTLLGPSANIASLDHVFYHAPKEEMERVVAWFIQPPARAQQVQRFLVWAIRHAGSPTARRLAVEGLMESTFRPDTAAAVAETMARDTTRATWVSGIELLEKKLGDVASVGAISSWLASAEIRFLQSGEGGLAGSARRLRRTQEPADRSEALRLARRFRLLRPVHQDVVLDELDRMTPEDALPVWLSLLDDGSLNDRAQQVVAKLVSASGTEQDKSIVRMLASELGDEARQGNVEASRSLLLAISSVASSAADAHGAMCEALQVHPDLAANALQRLPVPSEWARTELEFLLDHPSEVVADCAHTQLQILGPKPRDADSRF